jgi:caffeoyl-CoA O-methyltransferase
MIAISGPGNPRPVTPTTILARLLGELVHRLDGLDSDAREDLRRAFELADGLDRYADRWTTPESPALAGLADRTRSADWNRHRGESQLEQEMLSGHVEGQVLKMLVHATQATDVLEIGLFTGYSALAMAEALPAHGRVVACEIDADVAAFAQRCFAESTDGGKIDVRVGPASRTLGELATGGALFDLIFIDADKAGYLGYLDAVLTGDLLAPHGLICVDNTLMQGQPWTTSQVSANGKAIAEFNEAVAADPRVEQVIIALRDGLTLIRRAEHSNEERQ